MTASGGTAAEPRPYELTIAQVLEILRDGPTSLAGLTNGVAPARLRAAPEPDEWSAVEVLAHIRSCCDVWGGCIARIVNEDTPAFRAVSPRTWIRKTDYPELAFERSFDAYAAQRAELMAILDSLPSGGWSRYALVKQMTGQVGNRSVFYFANRLAGHEAEHVRQIARTVRVLAGA